jgi:hypothetical protein
MKFKKRMGVINKIKRSMNIINKKWHPISIKFQTFKIIIIKAKLITNVMKQIKYKLIQMLTKT